MQHLDDLSQEMIRPRHDEGRQVETREYAHGENGRKILVGTPQIPSVIKTGLDNPIKYQKSSSHHQTFWRNPHFHHILPSHPPGHRYQISTVAGGV